MKVTLNCDYLECPDSILVSSSRKLKINGFYTMTRQTRRRSPVWYNRLSDTYIFRATSNNWHITSAKRFDAGIKKSYAFAKDQYARCPQDLDYKTYINGKWTHETDLSVAPCKSASCLGKPLLLSKRQNSAKILKRQNFVKMEVSKYGQIELKVGTV